MRPIATDDSVAWYVSQSVTRLRFAKTAERIAVMFGVEIPGIQRNIVLVAFPAFPILPRRGRGRQVDWMRPSPDDFGNLFRYFRGC